MAIPVLSHRITVRPELWMSNVTGRTVVESILATVAYALRPGGPTVVTGSTRPTVLPPWRPTAAHFRATLLGVVGAVVAVAMNRPDLLVLITPWLVVTTWAWLRRPQEQVTVSTAVGHGTLREGEATVLRATVTIPDGVDDVVVAVSPSVFMEQDPPLGIRVIGLSEGRPVGDDVSTLGRVPPSSSARPAGALARWVPCGAAPGRRGAPSAAGRSTRSRSGW